MSNLVPTDEENARLKVDISEAPRSDRLYLLAELARKATDGHGDGIGA